MRDRPVLRRLLAAEGIAFVFFALVLPIEVAFAKDTLDAGDFGYGLLLAAWGAGMVVGSVLFSSLREVSLRALLVFGTLGIGVAYTATGLAPTLAFACAASALGGAGNGVQWVAIVTAIQGLTAEAYQARVIGLLESLASGLSGAGFLLGGVIAAVLSPRASYAVAGVGVLVVLAAAVLVLEGSDGSAAPERSLARRPIGSRTPCRPRRRTQPAQTQAPGPESAQICAAIASCSACRGLMRQALRRRRASRWRAGSGRRRRRPSWD